MNPLSIRLEKIRETLEADRVWCAYALADLDPSELPLSEWLVSGQAVILIYKGTDPPVLFAHGDPQDLEGLFRDVRQGEYAFALTGTQRSLVRPRFHPWQEQRMWRMSLRPGDFPGANDTDIIRLGPADEAEIAALFSDHADRPDAFYPRQLGQGTFFGIREADQLVSVAGTHVVSTRYGIGAVGNVFTRPDRRAHGLGTRATAAVVAELLRRDLQTIVLNVSMDNQPAQRSYRRLGFWPYCGYYEGIAEIARDPATPTQEMRLE